MATISGKFLSLANKAVFNSSEWTPVGPQYSLKDIMNSSGGDFNNVLEAEITQQMFDDGSIGKRITVTLKDGSSLDYRLSGKSTLEVGDKVDISSIYGQELKKYGRENIVRFDGKKAEE